MNSPEELTDIFKRNRRLAELNPDIAAETLAGKNVANKRPVAKRKARQGNAAPEASEPARAVIPPKSALPQPLSFTVPVPPSLNDAYPTYWKGGKPRRCATKRVSDFKDAVSIIVQIERAKLQWTYEASAGFSLTISLRFGTAQRRDISNCVKVLEDAISETLGFDDSTVDRLYVERLSTNDKNPGADVVLCELGGSSESL